MIGQAEAAVDSQADDPAAAQKWESHKRSDAGDSFTDDQLVYVVGAFVGEDGFEIVHVAHDGIVVHDAVGAENVAGLARGFEGDRRRCSSSAWRCAPDRLCLYLSAGRRAAPAAGL